MNNFSYAYPTKQGHLGFAKEGFGVKMTALPEKPKLAMAYVPFQTSLDTYDEMKGLKAGTLFPCLDKPFLGSGKR